MVKYKKLLICSAIAASTSFAHAATIDNSGFEDGWSNWNETEPAALSSDSYKGSKSLKIQGSPGRVYQNVDVDRNTQYTLSAYVLGKGQIGINDLNGLFKSEKFNVSSWTKVSKTFTTASTNSLQVFAKHDKSSNDVRFDNFSLTKGTSSGGGDTGGGDTGGGDTGSGSGIASNITNGSIFDLEGNDPHPLVNSDTLEFVPLEARHITPNGNGWRHEYKVKESARVAMTETYEVFEATVKVEMSDGGKTIISQHHASDTGTISKVYVSDTDESGFDDSVAGNGIFDVYVRLRNTSGKEEKHALGTIRSGGSFNLKVVNNYGDVDVTALGTTFGIPVEDDSESYFKFGNYLQSQDPYTLDECGESGNSDSFKECFKDLGITKAKVTMTDVSYTRKTN
ncbi:MULTISPECIES: polysaccharide lyase family 7 protein [unclassified Pseudoalteromonas]|uniref:polysaccharide lyase family 7 protein n=1 Tax=unclassified Pseudoalteromonas TaxID=194690 RepID=UPI0004673C45|nr:MULTISPECIES: polysaccharide lyase family 7 protein [unclassified Pseudoalteromonas]MBH0062601.1 polysaccharide lyase family 7 protein [Pseudoalteromonas sp. NZS71]